MSTIGIVVSGGPAPGINSVISSCVIEAQNRGLAVVGLTDGFDGLLQEPRRAIVPLSINDVSRIHTTGGSLLGTSRRNPLRDAQSADRFFATLREFDIDQLVVIGGDGSAYLSSQIHRAAPAVRVIHVPKTIDNDLELPHSHPSFGFESARHRGMEIVSTLAVDAKTCHRWFLLTVMGRRAGFLALGLGFAAGATSTYIPEEFPPASLSPAELAEAVFPTIELRVRSGKPYGVILMAEGLLDALDPKRSPELQGCPRDDIGRINYAQVELGEILQPHLEKLCRTMGLQTKIITKNIGYELRCCPPIAFDIEYTRVLGFGAIDYLNTTSKSGMVIRDRDSLGLLPFESFVRPEGTVRSRCVDLASDTYKIARRFMVKPHTH